MNELIDKMFTPEGAVIVAATAVTIGLVLYKYNYIGINVGDVKIEIAA